ncbi:50S ribosomal protein L22 [Patescibacteria group bacterium]|nr:50S ribosomal protein L22 [Patescibacteria group bacterium]
MQPRKVRLVADLVRGKKAIEAERQLSLGTRRAARPLLKLLQFAGTLFSALANAHNSFNLEKDQLFIETLIVEEGPRLKRWVPKARGSAGTIHKQRSHIKIVLNELQTAGARAGKSAKKSVPATAQKKSVPANVEKKPAAKPATAKTAKPTAKEATPRTGKLSEQAAKTTKRQASARRIFRRKSI